MLNLNKYYEEMGAYHDDAYGKDEPFTKYIDSILDFFEDKKGQTILDVGAGEGTITELLYKRGHKVDALDIAHQAKLLFQKKNIPCKYYCIDFLKFRKKYDWILFANTLHWIENERAAIKKVKGLMKIGAYITTTNAMRSPLDLRAYTKEEVEERFPGAEIRLQDGLRWVIVWNKNT
jgi:2-polyprenyl-3-methyl-5-hydroxy-6-metoxy-1,4-benzoquinol methylase